LNGPINGPSFGVHGFWHPDSKEVGSGSASFLFPVSHFQSLTSAFRIFIGEDHTFGASGSV
jgi:hypothetical protein